MSPFEEVVNRAVMPSFIVLLISEGISHLIKLEKGEREYYYFKK